MLTWHRKLATGEHTATALRPGRGADRGVGQNPGDPDTSQRMLQPSIAVLPGEGRDSAP